MQNFNQRLMASCLLLLSADVLAVDGVRIAYGSGTDSTDVSKVSLLKHFDKTWLDDRVSGHWELGISHWNASKGPVDDLLGLSFAPVFTYKFREFSVGIQPYIDYSLGLIYLSETKLATNDFGTHMQFDNRLGIGIRFGTQQHHDLNISLRHVSNAGLDEDNSGFDSHQLAYTYHF